MPPPGPANNPTDPALGGQHLSAPWRLDYIESLGKDPAAAALPATPKPSGDSAASAVISSAGSTSAGSASGGGFLRDYWLHPESDERNNVLLRSGSGPVAGMVLLNAYPYANGHLLVALGEPRPSLMDYSADQRAALWRLTDVAAALMQATLDPQGINIGINQGRAAGAGVPGHLHVHLVPRWNGDVNFMTVVGRVRVIPGSLEAMARRYRAGWERIRSAWNI